mgnify:FL=1
MRMKTKWVILSAIVLGILMGILWINIGDRYLDATFGQNNFNWFVLPFILPLIISIILFFVDNESPKNKKFLNSIMFFVFEFIGHWIPFAVLLT